MKNYGLILIILYHANGCSESMTPKSIEKVEQYQSSSVIHQDFLVAVVNTTTDTASIVFVPLNDYQSDQKLAEPNYKIFESYGRFYINPCIRTKFGCEFDSTAKGFKVNYRGPLGEGTTNIYKIENRQVIPVSFSKR